MELKFNVDVSTASPNWTDAVYFLCEKYDETFEDMCEIIAMKMYEYSTAKWTQWMFSLFDDSGLDTMVEKHYRLNLNIIFASIYISCNPRNGKLIEDYQIDKIDVAVVNEELINVHYSLNEY